MRSVPILIRSVTTAPRTAAWGPDARRVLEHAGGPLRVLGGPGTGKTTLVAHTVADRVLRRGVDPERVLVFTSSRRAAANLRERIVERLAAQGVTPTVREPLVRTVHSYAFAVLRLQASLRDLPPPRLLSGPEQDVVVRELLAGERAAGGRDWPARLRPALGLPAFAAQLRDLLMRAAERGLAPEDLIALGRTNGRDEWVAAGRFFRSYEQVMLLRGSVGTAAPQATAPALDAAELMSAALLVLDTDVEVLRRKSDRVRHLIVDEAQHLDPLQAALVTRLGASAHELLLLGDPDQTVFSFRGADPGLLAAGGSAVVRLRTDHRMAPAVRATVSRLASRLPGPRADLHGPAGEQPGGEVTVRVFGSAAAEASWVADQLRRAHLLDGVAWSDMAVLVRSTVRALPVLRRALLSAGVPVAAPCEELPVARQGAVLPMLGVLRCAVQPAALDEETAAALLTSPLGGTDPLALRRLRRELRRRELVAGGARTSGALLVDVLRADCESDQAGHSTLDGLDDRTAAPARRLASLLSAAARAARRGDSAEEVLWQVWQASGLAQRWAATAARGGPAGVQADRDLDAVVALFDAAARYADRLPGADGGPAGVLGFCDYLTDQQIAGDSLAARSPQGESVTVLTAHAAAGREWSLVAVPGVQEGSWPDLRLRGSLLGVEHLVDTAAGIESATVSRTAPLLAEERRLLLVAASRARRRLLVSAVRGEDEQPSRFLNELEGADELAGTDASMHERPVASRDRGLSLPELVAELRRVCCDPAEGGARRRSAAAGLAQLAQAGVPGAHPDSWYGLGPPSSDTPLRVLGEPARVSPSLVELVSSCPLRWLLTRHGGEDFQALPAVTGSLVHRLVQAVAAGATDQQLESALVEAWTGVEAGAPWYSRAEQQRVRQMVAMFRLWWRDSRGELTEVGCEQELEVQLPPADRVADGAADGCAVLLRGRVDRLERDRHGRPVIVDVKSSKTPVSKEAAEDHAQLAIYQLAAAHGAFTEHGLAAEPGGACIVQVSARTAASVQRNQQPLDGPALARWHEVVREAARRTAGPEFVAIDSGDCTRCPSKIACPLHDSGRQVTG
ncbi:MAG: ATP-dependent helicase [Pseudonocardiales bacterium]|nr:ATP-dependent helicase [Pseudonocardiales bacterium]MBV9728539.1 ATP-dependent helicase [Pseudonocardiales bacterium]